LGVAYKRLGEYKQAIDYYQQSLTIAREIGDRWGESIALCNLGETFIKLERYSEALEKLQLALEICKAISNRSTEALTYKNLATLHHQMGRPLAGISKSAQLAREFCQQALAIALELGIPLAQDCQTLRDKLEEEPNVSNS